MSLSFFMIHNIFINNNISYFISIIGFSFAIIRSKCMETTKDRLNFEQLPDAVAEIRDGFRMLIARIDSGSVSISPVKEEPRKLIGVDRACEIIGKAKNTLYRYTAHGKIPCYKQGKQIYFFEDEVLEWVRSGKRESIDEMAARTENDIIRLSPRTRR